MRLNLLKTEFPFAPLLLFAGAGFRASRLGDGDTEAAGDGDDSGVGLTLGLATAAASGTELRDLTATRTNASTSTAAMAAEIIISCFVDLLANETDKREKE
jgi:hypothetical protein